MELTQTFSPVLPDNLPKPTSNRQFFSKPESWLGGTYPLGATYDGFGVNFAIFSENAKAVELCLFDFDDPAQEIARIRITERTDHVWHIYLPDCKPGQLYGYRMYGEYNPAAGLFYNPAQLLLDPYAKAIYGNIEWHHSLFGNNSNDENNEDYYLPGSEDTAPYMLKAIVTDNNFDWENERKPNIPFHKSVIYEMHVKGFTALHPHIEPNLRGTYAGLASEPAIAYLKELGVTAVELMPIHQFIHDSHLIEKGLENYWGYNSIGFFAPHNGYAAAGNKGEQVNEFRQMVKNLHNAGIEVILDVVYNHTAEGNHLGPIISFSGIDNLAYYRLMNDNPAYYNDFTGTGNTLNMLHPRSLQLVMDSLRYWITEMHVDGFRFDLAPALARGLYEVGKLSAFFDTIHQDPVISQVKLIAEPWDIGEGGYQVGNFPVRWAEWNGEYRDCIRKFWKKNDTTQLSELAYRLTGSSDLYATNGRLPSASINFITAHDGYTLHDLVTYEVKHNEANGENNRDGHNNNLSWNCGIEGETEDEAINILRTRQKRNFMMTLLLSQGTPMICGGDEYGRTQKGNNNAYCQNNELSWMNWEWNEEQTSLAEFVRNLIKIRVENQIFHRRRFFSGSAIFGEGAKDVRWIRNDGEDMTETEWKNGFIRCMGMLLNGQAMEEYTEQGKQIKNDVMLIIFNSHWEKVPFCLPGEESETPWELWIDSYTGKIQTGKKYPCGKTLNLPPFSCLLLRQGV